MLMNNTTFEDYKKAVKAKYEEEKANTSGYLLNPTPASIKKYCGISYSETLSNSDKEIFRIFFSFNESAEKRKQIEKFETDKFRPIKTFLDGKTDTENVAYIDLIALLVGYKNRPLNNFRKKGIEIPSENKIENSDAVEISNLEAVTENVVQEVSPDKENRILLKKKNLVIPKKKLATICATLILLVISSLSIKTIYFPDKNCLVWKGDHYEAYVYEDIVEDSIVPPKTIPYDEKLLQMKKIQPTSKTIFFSETKEPIIWYIKRNNKCEFFNYPGLDPISGKPLRQISETIINNHVLKR